MVFFTCNACGESLKKNQVEKHYLHRCRRCEVLTCVDCHRDFPGDTYAAHVKCITEDEKYGAKGWQPKANANKGEKKQLAWIANLQSLMSDPKTMSSVGQDVRRVLEMVVQHENIPRKRQKFTNFVKNIMRGVRPHVIDNTWDLFEEALKKKPQEEKQVDVKADETNGDKDSVEEKKGDEAEEEESRLGVKMFKGTQVLEEVQNGKNRKKKKRKREEDGETEEPKPKKSTENGNVENEKFNWENTIEKLLTAKGEMKVKKLKKKVIAEYLSRVDTHKSEEELHAKLEKKLKKNPKFKLVKETVSLSK